MPRCPSAWRALALMGASCLACGEPASESSNERAPSASTAEALLPWAREGPRRLWSRSLGPGYSGIVAEDDRLYTMYRSRRDEIVIGLDAKSGETVWEHRYAATPVKGQDTAYGEGPNAAPLLDGNLLCTIGFSGIMHCLDRRSGEVRWRHDLWGELGGSVVELGYSASPVGYRGTILALVGGRGRGVVAFDRRDGRVIWKALDFEASYATPSIMEFQGQDQLVAFMATEVAAADPGTGELLWSYPLRNQYPQNICAPLRLPGEMIFVSTTEAGSRGLRVTTEHGNRVREVWSTTRVQCFYGKFALADGVLYGSSGLGSGPRMSAVDAATGEILWRVRGFNLSHVVAAGDRLVLLDDAGKLTLAAPRDDGLEVLAESRILSAPSLTPPTLRDGALYARDQREIVALRLASGSAAPAADRP